MAVLSQGRTDEHALSSAAHTTHATQRSHVGMPPAVRSRTLSGWVSRGIGPSYRPPGRGSGLAAPCHLGADAGQVGVGKPGPRRRVDHGFFQWNVAFVGGDEIVDQTALRGVDGGGVFGVTPVQQHLAQRRPLGVHAHVVGLQLGHRRAHARVSVAGQRREDVSFLVFMVVRAGNVEIAQHVAGGGARIGIVPLAVHVVDDALQQGQRALHALVAGFEHLEGLFEPDGGRTKAGQTDGRLGHAAIVPPWRAANTRLCPTPRPTKLDRVTRTRPASSAGDPARRPAWCAAALLALALALPGCAWLQREPDGNTAADGDRARSEATTTRTGDAAGDKPAASAFDIRVEAPDEDLRSLVARHNELQRYRAVTDLDDTEIARLMALAERDVRNLLGTEGYFNPTVRVRREGAAGARPTVVIAIEPGEPTTISRVDIGFEGDIAASADPDAAAQRDGIVEHWGLGEGRRFTQDRWSDAKTGALRRLVERRYPRGRISYSLADVSAAQARAQLGLRMDSGPPFYLGPAVVQGARRYPPELAERLSWLKPGDVYDQKKLVDAQQRLAGSGYYDSAYISIDPESDPAAAPVTYTVTEAKRHRLQLGVGYSTDGGPRVSLEHRDNTVFGTPWRATTKLHLDRKAPLLQTELTGLPDANGWRWAGLARYMRQDDGELVTTSKTLRIGRMKSEEHYDRNFYLQYDHANVSGSATRTSTATDALVGDGAAISANYAWTGRYFDSLPVPSRGYGLGGEIGAGMTTVGERKPFLRLQGRTLGIVPVSGGASRLALRTELGAVLASDAARLPSTYLFRTGGDTTVRGYGYRRIGIPLGDNFVGPGRYMAVGSVEWQRPIMQDRFPGLLEHTLFVDVGGVANRVGDLRPNWGVGTGVRLITPVGPMQLDLAYGLKSKEFRLHMNVGFVF